MPIDSPMDLPPALLQFLGSLAAILVLAALAWAMRLGPERTFQDEAEARAAADEAVSGFDPVEIALDRDGRGALLRNVQGQILLLRPHGTNWAGRILTADARVRIEGEALVIDTPERTFGTARLQLHEPSAWMQAIEAIEG